MNAIKCLLAIAVAVVLVGCAAPREYFIHRDVFASGNADTGNVYVHLCNFGQQRVLSFASWLKSDEGEHAHVDGLINFDVYDYVTYAFNVTPGHYWLEFSDGIRSEPWRVKFEATTKPVHIDLKYALQEPEAAANRKEKDGTRYEAMLIVELSDKPPKKGR